MIPLFKPEFDIELTLHHVRECLERGWTGIGFKTQEFEELFSNYIDEPYSYFTNSNTSGLHLLLEHLSRKNDWKIHHEVISSPLTFVSTNQSIINANLTPILADIDSSLCISLDNIRKLHTKNTKAVIYVSIGGNSAGLQAISSYCKEHGLLLILDAAHAAGSRLHERHLSYYADYSVFSFQAVKNLPTGDSGMIVCRDHGDAKELRRLGWCGIDKDTYSRNKEGYAWEYDVKTTGFKYHGNAIMASLGIPSLIHLDENNKKRRDLVSLYRRHLAETPQCRPIIHDNEEESSRHIFQLICTRRNDLIKYLANRGVSTGVHYKSNSRYPFLSGHHCPIAEELDETIITLPLYLGLKESEVSNICFHIHNFYSELH